MEPRKHLKQTRRQSIYICAPRGGEDSSIGKQVSLQQDYQSNNSYCPISLAMTVKSRENELANAI